jgi:hypothetical protein
MMQINFALALLLAAQFATQDSTRVFNVFSLGQSNQPKNFHCAFHSALSAFKYLLDDYS